MGFPKGEKKIKNALLYLFIYLFRLQSQIGDNTIQYNTIQRKRMRASLIGVRGIDRQVECGLFSSNTPLGQVCCRSRRNVYLPKIGTESFGDGSQDICKDTESKNSYSSAISASTEIIHKLRLQT